MSLLILFWIFWFSDTICNLFHFYFSLFVRLLSLSFFVHIGYLFSFNLLFLCFSFSSSISLFLFFFLSSLVYSRFLSLYSILCSPSSSSTSGHYHAHHEHKSPTFPSHFQTSLPQHFTANIVATLYFLKLKWRFVCTGMWTNEWGISYTSNGCERRSFLPIV